MMAYSKLEQLELLVRTGAAFMSVFTEEERARTPEFEQERKEFFRRIDADEARIGEIGANPNGGGEFEITLLRGRIEVLWKEAASACEERGSFADRKYQKFMALIFPSFGITDAPSCQDPDAKLLMELLLRPGAAN